MRNAEETSNSAATEGGFPLPEAPPAALRIPAAVLGTADPPLLPVSPARPASPGAGRGATMLRTCVSSTRGSGERSAAAVVMELPLIGALTGALLGACIGDAGASWPGCGTETGHEDKFSVATERDRCDMSCAGGYLAVPAPCPCGPVEPGACPTPCAGPNAGRGVGCGCASMGTTSVPLRDLPGSASANGAIRSDPVPPEELSGCTSRRADVAIEDNVGAGNGSAPRW
mmetsp:Transcript_133429/g.231871  ORF Transcript_133429/g.231871 Transcript_133429/m.231871 type:complete len:229 (+) Transcript_133429:436-1122(+)